jgi:hypothetical protein
MARLINREQLFIHTAKTGGTFFREALNYFGVPNYEVAEKHSSAKEAEQQLYKYNIDDWYPVKMIFGFVRNPITWYRSRWAFAKMTYFFHKLENFPATHPVHKHWMAQVWHDDLNVFVEKTLQMYPEGIAYDYFNRMLQINKWKTSGIKIYRYENLVYDTAAILSSTLNKSISINDVQNLKPQLQSTKIGGDISPMLKKEIQTVEHKLFKMYY